MALDAEENAAGTGRERAMRFALLAMVFLFVFTHHRIQGQNDLSRFVAVESLVNRGVFHIDGSRLAQQKQMLRGREVYMLVDRAYNELDGHFYSSKPPVLTLILAAPAALMRALGGEFDLKGSRVFLLTWLVVGGMSACGFYAFRRRAGDMMPPPDADLVTLAALAGTMFLSYSVTMNHHTVTASLILMAFFALGMADGAARAGAGRAAAAGFMMGLAAVTDIGHGFIFSICFALYILVRMRSWRTLLFYAVGGVLPLAVHCAVQYPLWHSILPVQMLPGVGDYPHSYWVRPAAPDSWHVARSRYWLLTLFSMRGLFTLSPVLLVGAAAMAHDIGRLRTEDRGRALAALSVLGGMLFLVGYYSFRAGTNFGGSCFGFRWYIGFTPLLAFYSARGYAMWRERARFRTIFYALAAVSLMYAAIGMRHPWLLMEANGHPAVQVLRALRGI